MEGMRFSLFGILLVAVDLAVDYGYQIGVAATFAEDLEEQGGPVFDLDIAVRSLSYFVSAFFLVDLVLRWACFTTLLGCITGTLSFYADWSRLLDLFVVVVDILSVLVEFGVSGGESTSNTKLIKIFRIFRVFKILRLLKDNRGLTGHEPVRNQRVTVKAPSKVTN